MVWLKLLFSADNWWCPCCDFVYSKICFGEVFFFRPWVWRTFPFYTKSVEKVSFLDHECGLVAEEDIHYAAWGQTRLPWLRADGDTIHLIHKSSLWPMKIISYKGIQEVGHALNRLLLDCILNLWPLPANLRLMYFLLNRFNWRQWQEKIRESFAGECWDRVYQTRTSASARSWNWKHR